MSVFLPPYLIDLATGEKTIVEGPRAAYGVTPDGKTFAYEGADYSSSFTLSGGGTPESYLLVIGKIVEGLSSWVLKKSGANTGLRIYLNKWRLVAADGTMCETTVNAAAGDVMFARGKSAGYELITHSERLTGSSGYGNWNALETIGGAAGNGDLALIIRWVGDENTPTTEEAQQLIENPWQIFQPQTYQLPTLAAVEHELALIESRVPWIDKPHASARPSSEFAKDLWQFIVPAADGWANIAPQTKGDWDLGVGTLAPGVDSSLGRSWGLLTNTNDVACQIHTGAGGKVRPNKPITLMARVNIQGNKYGQIHLTFSDTGWNADGYHTHYRWVINPTNHYAPKMYFGWTDSAKAAHFFITPAADTRIDTDTIVAVVYDFSTLRFFVDGVEVHTVAISSDFTEDPIDHSSGLIRAFYSDSTNGPRCTSDFLTIHNRAMSNEEIAHYSEDFNGRAFEPRTDLIPQTVNEGARNFAEVKIPWAEKPDVSARLDLTNPIAKKLSAAFIFNEGSGEVRDLLGSGKNGVVNPLATGWGVNEQGRKVQTLRNGGWNAYGIDWADGPSLNASSVNNVVSMFVSIGEIYGRSSDGVNLVNVDSAGLGLTATRTVNFKTGATIRITGVTPLPIEGGTVGCTYRPTDLNSGIYINGNLDATQSNDVAYTFDKKLTLLGGMPGNGFLETDYQLLYLFDGVELTAEEFKSLHDDPYQILQPRTEYVQADAQVSVIVGGVVVGEVFPFGSGISSIVGSTFVLSEAFNFNPGSDPIVGQVLSVGTGVVFNVNGDIYFANPLALAEGIVFSQNIQEAIGRGFSIEESISFAPAGGITPSPFALSEGVSMALSENDTSYGLQFSMSESNSITFGVDSDVVTGLGFSLAQSESVDFNIADSFMSSSQFGVIEGDGVAFNRGSATIASPDFVISESIVFSRGSVAPVGPSFLISEGKTVSMGLGAVGHMGVPFVTLNPASMQLGGMIPQGLSFSVVSGTGESFGVGLGVCQSFGFSVEEQVNFARSGQFVTYSFNAVIGGLTPIEGDVSYTIDADGGSVQLYYNGDGEYFVIDSTTEV